MQKKYLFALLGVFIMFYAGSCRQEWLDRPDKPVLFLDVSVYNPDPNDDWTHVTEVKIQDEDGNWTEIADKLTMEENSEGNRGTGYTFELEEGETYTKLSYIKSSQTDPIEIEIEIKDAENGMVYVVRVG